MQFGRQQPTGRLISLTPLIDVVFILLVFFMLASSFLDWRAIDLSVSSGAGAAASSQRAILISLRSDGSIAVGATPVATQSLQSVIAAKLKGNRAQRIVIRSDPGVQLQRAVDTLDLVRRIGATNVSLSRKR
ncbi:MAG: biopolymer transporter ExbD [Proteobacteria bacterium]|nr:biopolymer transporter ExbD [Pseudomonadota bacterium]